MSDPFSELDDDIRAACADRAEAFRRLMVKDSTDNRAAYQTACVEVDELLDLRHDLAMTESATV